MKLPSSSSRVVLPEMLRDGDRVKLVSPASPPSKEAVANTSAFLESLGLRVEVADHALDEFGYLAGTDDDRASDFNEALRDPGIKAIIATRGGKGAYRIADKLDFVAATEHPKLIVGFSEVTILHLALWRHCQLPGIHGAPWDAGHFGPTAQKSFVDSVFTANETILESRDDEPTGELTTTGKATGILLGGNQDSIATAAGWSLPSFDGAILLLEAVNMRLGHIDRQLTMLENAGHLAGLKGIVVGQFTECGPDVSTHGGWTTNDVLRDRIGRLGVPVLGGLPIGHGAGALAVPVGTTATLDADGGRLTVAAAVGQRSS